MAKLSIRIANLNDLDFWMNLINIAGWDNTVADAKRSLLLEPEGCFVANLDNEKVGIVNSFLYDNVGWVGNLIVRPEVRSKGVGEELMKHAINRLKTEGAESIRLDAVEKAITLYQRLGFRHEWRSLRYVGNSEPRTFDDITFIKPAEINEIARFDKKYFGLNRKKLLEKIRDEFPLLCYKFSTSGKIKGYIMARLLNDSVKIGPWICSPDDENHAEGLLHAVMRQVTGIKVKVGIPELNKISIRIVEKNKFEQLPQSYRMCLGNCKKLGKIEGIFGIGTPDKG
jgi:ribosomal protein S18 acetylase RimI-like enzyme